MTAGRTCGCFTLADFCSRLSNDDQQGVSAHSAVDTDPDSANETTAVDESLLRILKARPIDFAGDGCE